MGPLRVCGILLIILSEKVSLTHEPTALAPPITKYVGNCIPPILLFCVSPNNKAEPAAATAPV